MVLSAVLLRYPASAYKLRPAVRGAIESNWTSRTEHQPIGKRDTKGPDEHLENKSLLDEALGATTAAYSGRHVSRRHWMFDGRRTVGMWERGNQPPIAGLNRGSPSRLVSGF
jgi:hypothetical protein